jgi:PAS domain S-box-containing protein
MQHVYDHMAMSAASTSAASSLRGFGGSELSSGTSKKDRGNSREARNTREQRRAHKISQLIDQLKEMLDDAQFSTKSTSKLHILTGCEDYIRSVRQQLDDSSNSSSCSSSASPVPHHLSSGMLGSSGEDGSSGSGNGSDNDSNSGSNSGSSNSGSSNARRSGSSGSDGGSTSNDNSSDRGSTQSPTSIDGNSTASAAAAAAAADTAASLNFRDWFRLNPMPMCVASAAGNVVDANDRFLKAMGMTSQQAMGASIITLISPEHLQSVLLPLSRMLGSADAAARIPITVPAARTGQLLTLSTVLSPAGQVVCLHLVLLPAPEHSSSSSASTSGAAAVQSLQ